MFIRVVLPEPADALLVAPGGPGGPGVRQRVGVDFADAGAGRIQGTSAQTVRNGPLEEADLRHALVRAADVLRVLQLPDILAAAAVLLHHDDSVPLQIQNRAYDPI